MIEAAIISALNVVAALAPGVLALATGKESDADAIAHLITYVRALPEREAAGGDDTAGGWDEDLRRRKAGGADAPSVPASMIDVSGPPVGSQTIDVSGPPTGSQTISLLPSNPYDSTASAAPTPFTASSTGGTRKL